MRATPTRNAAAGFTLFEVMAAVLILGVLYSVLATSAIEGLRAEGESRRRLEASLLADDHLIELESSLDSGVFPEIGTEETETDDGYRITVEVTPFDVTPYLGEDFAEDLEQGDAASLLEPPDTPEESLLRLISVAVRWSEAEGEHEVRRTTLAYDQATLVGMLPNATATGGEEGDEGQAPVDEEGGVDIDEMLKLLGGP